MTGKEVIDSFNNAWRALAKQYTDRPDESTRCAMNLIAKMIGEVESQVNRPRKEGQITMDEWLAMLQEGILLLPIYPARKLIRLIVTE